MLRFAQQKQGVKGDLPPCKMRYGDSNIGILPTNPSGQMLTGRIIMNVIVNVI